ncbi:hypothetical protein [Falsiroseomonas stagni]|uniref:Uncharacterized protein n=1 Tax=Falsiroseomonas stagni DSM 19981 TaxID=1123062 RepID=A0A1I4BE64_9PROT|nr:hypothetical protein [Falsiroseomonas stagni]SFK66261.1 hypothetical protein SAMN02745775_105168 [Falsiroseomonas stagni DSM 19981]
MPRLAWLVAVLMLGAQAPAARAQDRTATPPVDAAPVDGFPALRVLSVARQVELDMSAAEAIEVLLDGGLVIDQQRDLPPDGLSRLILAVPDDDDCMPRGAQLVCPSVRVFLINDPQRGHRVTRVEAYQRVDTRLTVAQVFEQAATAMGPALQTEMWPEQVRGGSVVVWRQRWREDLADGPSTEVIATQQPPDRPVFGMADPNARATGVGVVIANVDAEGAFSSVRRRLGIRPQR